MLGKYRWYLETSKSFMNYPYCGRVYFWARSPRAFFRLLIMEIKDWWKHGRV